METNSKTTNMETTKELIAHVNDMVANVKSVADQCEWMTLASKQLGSLELERFVDLCEWRGCEPKVGHNTFSASLKIGGVSVYIESDTIPELVGRKQPSVLDLIKSILADRKAQANAA